MECLNVAGQRDVGAPRVLAVTAQISVPTRRRPGDGVPRHVVRPPGIGVKGDHVRSGAADKVAELRVADLTPVIVHVENGVGEVVADGIEPVDGAGPLCGVVQVPFVAQLERHELAQVGALGGERWNFGLIAGPA